MTFPLGDANPDSKRRCLRAWQWTRQDQPGSEYCELRELDGGWELAGSVVVAEEGAPFLAEYTVACDSRWLTREARILLRRGGTSQSLVLRADEQRRWWRGDEEVPQFRGCTDVDLGFTPSTNTLPIRRLSLEVGQSSDVTAAWVRMPDLALLPLPQRYTRLSPTRFRYESRGGSFVAELETDELGLVTRYPPAWERVAVTSR
ncbi:MULTISPECIES: putative glycolipid-binding domain-containing protein [unclassified Myxococcus]|uniref:putative glycolipid-binding domain-containing protein n=1 Tax=unclassified Myxococcus TaxID=2648731 RepID=UPI00157B3092|nr:MULTISPECIES: putative glycolipid-binding domain-containing protein [unclassified Myxococcus]NTX34628.1 putative glycolipid-binding domain-containing protein [Myxococcus sp. CA033]NTX49891.1 putative glycolipid-binding domain-containing protein [Myxococcus sp. CA039A]